MTTAEAERRPGAPEGPAQLAEGSVGEPQTSQVTKVSRVAVGRQKAGKSHWALRCQGQPRVGV